MNQEIQVTTLDSSYPILVGKDVLPTIAKFVPGACAIITNPTVGKLYAGKIAALLPVTRIIEMPDGEEHKTLNTVRAVYDRLIDAQLDRQSTIIALGGGVVGDLAGFVAATYLRGVPFVQMPTTLLAMVDASIGGKVAVDHPHGKNLIGAFKQPRAVIADLDVLATLPAAEWRSGMAEAVKHGMLGDKELFEKLETGDWKLEMEDWLPRAIQVKVEFVQRDPFERGERIKLNLGHTFGHAFEKLSDYRLRHGDAVAIGLACAVRLAHRLQMCDATLVERIEALLHHIGLPTRVPREMPVEKIIDAMQTDKKRVGGQLHFILPRAIGDVVIVDNVARQDVSAVIEELRDA